MKIRIGTRGSVLALWQANWVGAALEKLGISTELVLIKTGGDLNQTDRIAELGVQGVFTKEIQRKLLDGEVDLAVHSLKDLPSGPVEGLKLAAVPERAFPFDAFLSPKFATIEELPENAVIGTGSVRRMTQIVYRFGNKFQIRDIRGNLDTRLGRLESGEYDAIIIAEAGLARLGLSDKIRQTLAPPLFLPAIGQGALGLEIRANDEKTVKALAPLDHADTHIAVAAERAFLHAMQGGCSSPIAALGIVANGKVRLHGRVLAKDGSKMFENTLEGPIEMAENMAVKLAENLPKPE